MVAAPQLFSGGLPVLCIGVALRAEVFDRFPAFKIGRMCAGLFDHLAQHLRVLEHRAGAEMVLVERLTVMVGHEDRRTQAVDQRLLTDVAVGVVDSFVEVLYRVSPDELPSIELSDIISHCILPY